MKISDKKIREIGEYLLGTCHDAKDAIKACGLTVPESDLKFLELQIRIERYNEIFLCDTCGWWFESEEMRETEQGQECGQCAGSSE